MRKPREQDTVAAILQLLHAHRIPAWRINTGATTIGGRFIRFGTVGMSDIVGIVPRVVTRLSGAGVPDDGGRFLAIEVKRAQGLVTPAQQRFLDQVTAAGGTAFVARSVDDVARAL